MGLTFSLRHASSAECLPGGPFTRPLPRYCRYKGLILVVAIVIGLLVVAIAIGLIVVAIVIGLLVVAIVIGLLVVAIVTGLLVVAIVI